MENAFSASETMLTKPKPGRVAIRNGGNSGLWGEVIGVQFG